MNFYRNLFSLLVCNVCIVDIKIYALPSEGSVVLQQVNLLKELMVVLHKFHNFDNLIFYRTNNNNNHNAKEYIPKKRDQNHIKYIHDRNIYESAGNILAEHVISPKVYKTVMALSISHSEYANNTKALPSLSNILTNKNLAVVILSDIQNYELKEFVALSLSACLETKIVFLLVGCEMVHVSDFVRLQKMKRFFRWCWSKNILNVILLFQKHQIKKSLKEVQLEVYTYTPFPEPIKIIRLTEQHPKEYYVERTYNLLGYMFRTPVFADKPLVFKYLDPFTGAATVTGIAGKIYMEYVCYVNAEFKEIKGMKYVNGSWIRAVDYVHNLLNSGNVDISIHPMTALSPNKFFSSYPISNSNCCVVVPVKQELFPGLYIPRTFRLEMWLLLLITFMIFQLMLMCINYNNYGLTRPWLAFLSTLKGLLNMPIDNMIGSINVTSNSRVSVKRKMFVHILLLITGMIYCQAYIAALSSFLSSTLYPEQIESLEDLKEANLSIMLVEYIYKAYNYLDLIPNNFNQNLIITDANAVSYHLNRLDTRYAYTVYNEEWKVMQRLQMHLSKPLFKIVPKLCIPNIYLTLPMQFNSPFYHSFKEFTLRAQATGLYSKWSDMIYWQIQKANGLNASAIENQQHPVPIALEHLTYILYIYVAGMLLAIVVFVIELNMPVFRENLNLP